MFRSLLFLIGPVLLIMACASTHSSEFDTIAEEALLRAEDLEKRRRVNENWSVDCITDQITTGRRCVAATFGQTIDYMGQGYGSKNIPFQVFFWISPKSDEPPPPPPPGVSAPLQPHIRGPFVQVGFHTFPGRYPTVRVDDNEPVTVNDDGGVSLRKPDADLVDQLRQGKIVRARFHLWPEGGRDMIVDIAGFEKAWQRLQELIQSLGCTQHNQF